MLSRSSLHYHLARLRPPLRINPGAAAVWFNDFDHHGVEAAPFFRYSLRVDGVFTDAFRARLASSFA